MAEIYKKFSLIKRHPDALYSTIKVWDEYDSYRDFSDEAKVEAYLKESEGIDSPIRRANGLINGYIEGKQWMDLTITEYWLPDIKSGELRAFELYLEEDLPKWFLDKVLPEQYHLTEEELIELKKFY